MSDLSTRLVDREIYYCVSSLIDSMRTLSESVAWQQEFDLEEFMELFSRIDYEAAGREFLGDADLDQLEQAADGVGYFSDALQEAGAPEGCDPQEWFDSLADPQQNHTLIAIRSYVENLGGCWQEFCIDNDVSTDEHVCEVYEHWIVSDWLIRKLAEKGEVVGEFAGLTIWARCTTGQSISMDHVIEQIAEENLK